MKKLKYIIGLLSVVSITLFSCEKEFDGPTITDIPTGNVLTISELRAMYVPGDIVDITEDLSIQGVIVADESSGNLYKESYIQDETGAINLRFISSTGLYIGDSVRVYLKGSKLMKYNKMMQVDSLHPDNNITKLATLKNRTPQIVTINDILYNLEDFQGELIQLNYVHFIEGGQGKTYADADNLESITRVLQDINNNQIDVRTSGYANFASDTIPSGVGTFIGVMAQYNDGAQLLIRNPNELIMDGDAPEQIIKDFSDLSLTSGGWSTKYPSGTISWTVGGTTNPYAYITNTSSKLVGESWLISPAFDLSSSLAPLFSFRTATYAANNSLEVYVSTNYDGVSSPTSATWINLTSQSDFSAGGWSWTASGNIDLSPYQYSDVYIAFKFNGTSSSWDTWEVDDIKIFK
jgi:hypothetical protein